MKLCFLGWADHIHLERWAGYFAQLGHEVSVISLSGRGRYPGGVQQYVLGLEKRGLRWKSLKLRYLLARIRPDVVHAHWAHFSYLAARASARPLVVTAWGSDVYRLGEQNEAVVQQLQHGLQAARLITCDSRDLLERLCRIPGVTKENVHVIQWGVDERLFRPAPPDARFSAELDVAGRPVILSARQMFPMYNQETVVAAFALVRQQIPDAVLLLKHNSGDTDYVRKLQQRIDEAGLRPSVRVVGLLPYERMADLYRLAQVTVSVPFSDGTPMSLLEAMACGSAPVVSDLPSLGEWIREGWNGHLVAPSDSAALAAHVVRLLRDPLLRSAYANRNLEIVRTRATQQANMATMEELYRQLRRQPAGRVARQAAV
jgi:glycosyltransferase involved in cell wall biosynthesis